MSVFQIPLRPRAQTFSIALAGVTYRLTWRYNSAAGCWMLSIADANGVRMASNIPVVTGRDLLEPFRYLGIGGAIVVQTDNDPDAVPTYANLGRDGKVYFFTGPLPTGTFRFFVLNQSILA